MKTGIVFCYLLAGIVLCIGTASGTVVSLSDADKSLIVKTHNDIRSDVSPTAANMIKLEWSDVLANIAHTHAEKCTYAHSDKTERNKAGAPSFSSVGENILAGVFYKIDYQDLINNQWGAEKQHYSYPNCNSGEDCGHYTQIAWAKTTHVGCAVADCPFYIPGYRLTILVCNYGPAGNFDGVKPYIQGSSCTQCPAGLNTCSNKLCSFGSTVDTSSSQEAFIQLIMNMMEAERERE
ncbi:peptidase inhibitor 16-like isoform X2 [Halichondria panicea]|uniref:peptidase inhibitor 16-like isoform X2 n=1 Tax=Halichondria panicea TaxID=6063 RepID=UPI00312BC525